MLTLRVRSRFLFMTAIALVLPATVNAAPTVTVVNTETNPVITRDVDNGARNFFQTATGVLTNAFNPQGFGLTLTTVPAGKVLVIEYLSAACQGSVPVAVSPSTLRLGTNVDHFFALTPTTFPAEGVTSQVTRIYAGPLTAVNLTVFPTTNTPLITCNVAISGYLLNQ